MSQAYVSDQSGDGDTFGSERIEASITYVSQIDQPGDDPIAPVEAVCPVETRHPLERYRDLRVQRYLQRKTVNPLVWLVDVIFDYPDRAGFRGWRTHVTFGSQIERIYRDLDGKPIGAFMYDPRPPVSDAEGLTPTAWFTKTIKGEVDLHRPESEPHRREGLDVFAGASTVVLTRRLHRMTAEKIRLVQTYLSPRATCNSEQFIAWGKGELLFQQCVIREEWGPTDSDERIEGFNYPIELHFAVRLPHEGEPEGWRTQKLYDWYTDDRGNESLVLKRADENPVEQEYRRYEGRNFAEIVAILEGGSPTQRIIRRPKR